ncbi:MAG: RodZ domain-containing protein [Acidimicrobiales bacterium]
MTTIVIVVLVVLVLGAVVWSRLGSGRSDRRAMENYGRALGVLGDVSRRSEHSANVRALPHEESGTPHVRTEHLPEEGSPPNPPATPAGRESGEHAEEPDTGKGGDLDAFSGPTRPIASIPTPVEGGPLTFEDVTGGGTGAAGAGGAPLPAAVRKSLAAGRGHEYRNRRLLTGAATGVVVVAIALLGLKLASGPGRAGTSPKHGHSSTTGRSTTHRHDRGHQGGGSHPGTTTGGTTTGAQSLRPVSTSSTKVSFAVASGSYRLSFADTGSAPCWVGVQQSGSGGWLWMTTLAPGQSADYAASGAVTARLGAPANASLKVNGEPAQLPGYVQPYDVSFNPPSGSPAS